MKIRTEDVYRFSLFVPVLFFIREYYYVFSEILSGNSLRAISSGKNDISAFLSIPLLAYLLTVAYLLLRSMKKMAKEIFRVFVFAPIIHSAFVIVFFILFSYITVMGMLPVEGTMFSVLVAFVAAIVVIPVGYFFMGLVALLYMLVKKIGLIEEQNQTS